MPKRGAGWWIYGLYLAGTFIFGTYYLLTQPSYRQIGFVSIAFDAVAAYCYLCFLLQHTALSRTFWQFFALLYTGKFLSSLGLLIYLAIRFPWNGSTESMVNMMGFVGALLTLPMVAALYIYAFSSDAMWTRSRPQP